MVAPQSGAFASGARKQVVLMGRDELRLAG